MPRVQRLTAQDLWPSDPEDNTGATASNVASSSNTSADTARNHPDPAPVSESEDVERVDVISPTARRNAAANAPDVHETDDRTFATPTVGHIASNYFENVTIIGENPDGYRGIDSAVRNSNLLRVQQHGYATFIQSLMDQYHGPPPRILPVDRRTSRRHINTKGITLGEEIYQVRSLQRLSLYFNLGIADWRCHHHRCRR